MRKISGDFETDFTEILEGLTQRGMEHMAVSMTMRAGGQEFHRNFMDVVIPLIIAGIELGLSDDSLSREELRTKDFYEGLKKMVSLACMHELLDAIERKELKTILKGLKEDLDGSTRNKIN